MPSISSLSRLPGHRPWTVLVATLAVTALFAAFAAQTVQEDNVATTGPRAEALDILDSRFGDATSVLTVVVTADNDLRTPSGTRIATSISEAIRSSDLAATLVDGPQPSIVSWADSPASANEKAPGSDGRAPGLIDRDDPSTALLLVFQDTRRDGEPLNEDSVVAQQADMAELIRDLDLPAGVHAEPFAFELLLSTSDDIGGEIAQLFSTALAAILLVLAIVYWPRLRTGSSARAFRRTLADVCLTLAVIIMAVLWMQGVGVLLGPDYAGLLGYFSPPTQVVPILIVGLGVDFAIHLLRRYRAERARGLDAAAASDRTLPTVGVALALGTAATAAGFLTNVASPLKFLGMLGVLAATGITAAFLLTAFFVPAVRVLLDRGDAAVSSPDPTGRRQTSVAGRAAWLAERAPLTTLVVAAAVAALAGAGYTQLDSRFDVTDFVPQDEPMLDTLDTLETQFGGGFDSDLQVLLLGDITSPEAHRQLVATTDRLAGLLTDETASGRVTSPVTVLRQARANSELNAALDGLGVRHDGTLTDAADVDAVYRFLASEIPSGRDVVDLTGETPAARVVTDGRIPDDSALADQLDDELAAFDDVGVSATATSSQLVQDQLTQRIADSQLAALFIALGAATLLLMGYFHLAHRHAVLGMLTVAPVGFVVTATLAAMAVTDIPLNPVTATLAALSIGIGVPYTIHITNRYLEERGAPGPAGAVRRTLDNTGVALTASAITTIIGFGVLTTSTLLPFQQLGFVTLFAIASSLLAAVLILPSLLILWERRQAIRCEHSGRRSHPQEGIHQ